MSATARPRPCASCPYRRDVPSGVWAAAEYQRLPDWDGGLIEQSQATFRCHQMDGSLCSGWVAHRGDPTELLAVRIGIASGHLAPEVADYSTTVPLFGSGREACEHGMRDVDDPGPDAQDMAQKIVRARGIGGPTGIILGLVVVVLALLSGCQSAQVWACATTSTPPVVLDRSQCSPEVGAPSGSYARWYSAPASDIGSDDIPIVGQPLDGDFWDLSDRLDLDDATKTTPKKTTTTTTNPKARS